MIRLFEYTKRCRNQGVLAAPLSHSYYGPDPNIPWEPCCSAKSRIQLTCDLANANTETPNTFVSVMPDKTLLPTFEIAILARSSLFPDALQYARTMCETNSTPRPTH